MGYQVSTALYISKYDAKQRLRSAKFVPPCNRHIWESRVRESPLRSILQCRYIQLSMLIKGWSGGASKWDKHKKISAWWNLHSICLNMNWIRCRRSAVFVRQCWKKLAMNEFPLIVSVIHSSPPTDRVCGSEAVISLICLKWACPILSEPESSFTHPSLPITSSIQVYVQPRSSSF